MEECVRASETVPVQRKRGNDSGKEKEEKRWLVEERKSDREGATERETGKSSVEGREADGERERGKETNERVRDRGRYRVAVHGAREKR